MPYSAGDIKWGTPLLGEPSGVITWSADYVDALNFSPTYSANDFDAALQAAFDTWETVASIDFQMVASGSPADVTVTSADLGGAAGLAYFRFEDTPGLSRILEGEITFNTLLNWAPFGSGGADFFAVALHEIGHIIGLGHVNDPNEIMNPTVFADSLGPGDIAGAQFLYGTDPGDVEAPPDPNANPGTGGVSGGSGDGGGGGGAIALVMGILAALLGLIFGGGAGAAAALAVGRVPDTDEPGDAHEHHESLHDHDLDVPGVTEHLHVVYLPDMPLPMVAFDDEAGSCGCYGPCDCALRAAEPEYLF